MSTLITLALILGVAILAYLWAKRADEREYRRIRLMERR